MPNHNHNRPQHGSALLTVMVVMGVVGFAMLPMVWLALQQPQSVRVSCNRMRAKAIAEAGISLAFQKLSTNFDLRNDPSAFPSATYAGGSYTTTVTSLTSTTATIACVGVYQGVAAQ